MQEAAQRKHQEDMAARQAAQNNKFKGKIQVCVIGLIICGYDNDIYLARESIPGPLIRRTRRSIILPAMVVDRQARMVPQHHLTIFTHDLIRQESMFLQALLVVFTGHDSRQTRHENLITT